MKKCLNNFNFHSQLSENVKGHQCDICGKYASGRPSPVGGKWVFICWACVPDTATGINDEIPSMLLNGDSF
jgi:hypothetical protein